jgi:FAD/FMN-containing dehydrogenase
MAVSTLPPQVRALQASLGPKGWVEDPAVIAPWLSEWRGRWQGATPVLLQPSSTDEVEVIVRACAETGTAITPQGGNTGLVGGQTPQGEVLLSLRRMTAIRSLSATDDAITVEAGATLQSVHDAAATIARTMPLSLASQGSATIGGLISTNAGGVHVVRYGMMRRMVLGLEAVMPDGSRLNQLSALRKDNTGYDIKQLLIGAEGTLGVITAATLELQPRPEERVVVFCALTDPLAARALLARAKGETGSMAAFELIGRRGLGYVLKNIPGTRDPFEDPYPWYVLIEFEAHEYGVLRKTVDEMLARGLDAGEVLDVVVAQNDAQAASLWRLREEMSSAQKPEGRAAKHDVSVPVSSVPEFLARADAACSALLPGVRIVAFGHMGDGNIHYDVGMPAGMPDEDFLTWLGPIHTVVHDLAANLSGSISAEHGIGVARREDFSRLEDPVAYKTMKGIKALLDPQCIMNPRVLFP